MFRIEIPSDPKLSGYELLIMDFMSIDDNNLVHCFGILQDWHPISMVLF